MADVMTAEEVTEMRQRVESGKIPEQGNVLILLSTCEQLRAHLESVEAALRFYANDANWFPGVGINRGAPCSVEADEGKRARAALATANDGNTG